MELPELFDLVFNPSGRQFDQVRYALLEWVLNLKNGTMEKVREKRTHFAAVIITLMYLVQVYYMRFICSAQGIFDFDSHLICMTAKGIDSQRGKHHFVYGATNTESRFQQN